MEPRPGLEPGTRRLAIKALDVLCFKRFPISEDSQTCVYFSAIPRAVLDRQKKGAVPGRRAQVFVFRTIERKSQLERKPGRNLDDARVGGCENLTKRSAGDIRVRIGELGLVKNIEEFESEFQLQPLPQQRGGF